MIGFACLERVVSRSGEARYRLGHPLVDRYLEFVAGRARPNTLRAVAFDLKVFFTVVAKDPVTVAPVDVSEFLAHQRGDRTMVRLADRESGLSARTSRLSSVSGLYGYLIARGDTRCGSARCRVACRRGVTVGPHGRAGAGSAYAAQVARAVPGLPLLPRSYSTMMTTLPLAALRRDTAAPQAPHSAG